MTLFNVILLDQRLNAHFFVDELQYNLICVSASSFLWNALKSQFLNILHYLCFCLTSDEFNDDRPLVHYLSVANSSLVADSAVCVHEWRAKMTKTTRRFGSINFLRS